MKTLIVDDNLIAVVTLKQLASTFPGLEVIGECVSAKEALSILQEQAVDLLLLDIEMPEMSGLELVKALGKNGPLIVFTTSKKEFAVEAFELNVVDYLVKPIMPARFKQAIDRVKEILENAAEEIKVSEDEFIFVRDSSIIRKIKLDDIIYVEAMGDYVKLHTAHKLYAIHITLKAVEARLPNHKFFRVHRSFIVALSHIESIQDGSIVIHNKTVPVADAYRNAFNKRLNIL